MKQSSVRYASFMIALLLLCTGISSCGDSESSESPFQFAPEEVSQYLAPLPESLAFLDERTADVPMPDDSDYETYIADVLAFYDAAALDASFVLGEHLVRNSDATAETALTLYRAECFAYLRRVSLAEVLTSQSVQITAELPDRTVMDCPTAAISTVASAYKMAFETFYTEQTGLTSEENDIAYRQFLSRYGLGDNESMDVFINRLAETEARRRICFIGLSAVLHVTVDDVEIAAYKNAVQTEVPVSADGILCRYDDTSVLTAILSVSVIPAVIDTYLDTR